MAFHSPLAVVPDTTPWVGTLPRMSSSSPTNRFRGVRMSKSKENALRELLWQTQILILLPQMCSVKEFAAFFPFRIEAKPLS